MYPALKSFFSLENQPYKVIKIFFENDFNEIYLWFICSLMSVFHNKRELIETENHSMFKIISVIDSIVNVLQERYSSNCYQYRSKNY